MNLYQIQVHRKILVFAEVYASSEEEAIALYREGEQAEEVVDSSDTEDPCVVLLEEGAKREYGACSLKAFRERVGLRTVEVAAQLGVADSTVRNWETKRTIPKLRIDQIAALCQLYKVSFNSMVQAVMRSDRP